MSKRSHYLLPSFLVLGGLLASAVWSADPPADTYGARLATYDKAAGESYFALSLTPPQRVAAAPVQDIVILADTSASQTGLFRTDSLLAVKTLVQRLDPQDRVKLFAVDLEAVPLSEGFVEAGSQEMNAALAKLDQRTPLGSTDMVLALQAAVDSSAGTPERPRAVIYVGDGLSRANFFGEDEIRSLVGKLVAARAPVSSLAIGPARSIEFLAVIANQTGGVLWLDSDEEASAEMGGAALAKAAQQPVWWPSEAHFPPGLDRILSVSGSTAANRSRHDPDRQVGKPRSAVGDRQGRGTGRNGRHGLESGCGAIQRRFLHSCPSWSTRRGMTVV